MADPIGILMEMGRGKAIQQINGELGDVIDAMRDSGGDGELTLRIKLKPTAFTEDGQVTEVGVSYTTATKRPRQKSGASTFFVGHNGELTRHNPDQMALDIDEPKAARRH